MKVILNKKAQKQLDRLNEPAKGRILKAILDLENEPPEGDIKPLRGSAGIVRLRVGDFRILFFEKDKRINVFKIAPRGGVYRRKK